jgi:SAM-dependent methyltransferase
MGFKYVNSCILCKSTKIDIFPSIISPFIAERIWNSKLHRTSLLKCNKCGFIFHNPRLDEDEEKVLYDNYRGEEYLKQRIKHEQTYSKELNELIGKNPIEIENRKLNLSKILNANLDINKIRNVLDFGGDKGQHIINEFKNIDKYVFDLSRVPTLGDIKTITDIYDSENKFDLITCCHVLEHVSSPIEVLEQIKSFSHEDTIFYLEVPLDNPFIVQLGSSKSIIHYVVRKIMFMKPIFLKFVCNIKSNEDIIMHEHVNFFSTYSMEMLLDREGFTLISILTKEMDFGWCKLNILCVLAKLKKI